MDFAGSSTYHPRLVHEIVDGMEGIDARDAAVLQSEDDVLPVVGRVSSVLPQQHEVRPDRSVAAAATTISQSIKQLQPSGRHVSINRF